MSDVNPVINAEELEVAPGIAKENLEGWVPTLASDEEIREAFEKAFSYRGDITITLKNGETVEGYLFDRRPAATLQASEVRVYTKVEKISISYADIAGLAFTGRDTAAGKSWEAWVKKYVEKKQAGETNIALEPESLD